MREHRPTWLIVVAAGVFVVSGCGGGKGAVSTTIAATSTTTAVPADAGTWSLIPDGPNPLSPPMAWTGTDLLVAEGSCCASLGSVNLSAYDPSSGVWHTLPATPLTPRNYALGTWTGTEMIVAGGLASADGLTTDAVPVTDGAALDAATNTWHSIAPMPTTLLMTNPTAVWTGREVLVWASFPDTNGREVVLAYNPSTNTWRSLPPSGLTPRAHAIAVWSGKELVVWGGSNLDSGVPYGDGARLDPTTDTWRRLPPAPVPARSMSAAVWSGHEVLLWGGDRGAGGQVGQGAAYNPTTNTWRALPLSPSRAKSDPAGVWTGRVFLVIGGATSGDFPPPGPSAAAYDPTTNSWTALPAAPPYPAGPTSNAKFSAAEREGGMAVWTGKAVLLVGGGDHVQQGPLANGVQWTPAGP